MPGKWVILSSKLFPTAKFDGETTKHRDYPAHASANTQSWKPEEVSNTGLKGIFDTTNKAAYKHYKLNGKEGANKDLLKAPIF